MSFLKYKFFHIFIITTFSIITLTQNKQTESKVTIMNIYYSKTSGKFTTEVSENIDPNAVASATYTKKESEDGWDYLTVSGYEGADNIYPDDIKSYAMGYLEGVLTKDKIYDFYPNLLHSMFYNSSLIMPENIRVFIERNLEYIKEKSFTNKDTSVYWEHVYYIYKQMMGLFEGYNDSVEQSKKIDLNYFQMFFALGDIEDMAFYNNTNARPDFKKMTKEEILDFTSLRTHCSALIKVADDFSDIWFGHNTWTTFGHLMRIFKEYRFITNKKTESSKVVAFPSYPGVLDSNDDFYFMDNNIYVMETTNSIYNSTIYNEITPASLPTWIRVMLANRIANDSKSWVEIFRLENSGTYNNQFQVLDLNKIDLNKKVIGDGCFYIVEQIPGYTEIKEVTDYLRKGYWPSYNIPFLKNVQEKAGYNQMIEEKPEMYSDIDYSACPRAKIFRRDQSNVKSIEDYKKILRYNQYQTDEFSKGDPALSLASRYDLRNPEGKTNIKNYCFGATDVKFGSVKELKEGKKILHIISGPTNDNQTTFDWEQAECVKQNPERWYQGKVLNKWNFPWIDYELQLFKD